MPQLDRLRSNAEVLVAALMSGAPVQYRDEVYQVVPTGTKLDGTEIQHSPRPMLCTLHVAIRRGAGGREVGKHYLTIPCEMKFDTLYRITQDMTQEERLYLLSVSKTHHKGTNDDPQV